MGKNQGLNKYQKSETLNNEFLHSFLFIFRNIWEEKNASAWMLEGRGIKFCGQLLVIFYLFYWYQNNIVSKK